MAITLRNRWPVKVHIFERRQGGGIKLVLDSARRETKDGDEFYKLKKKKDMIPTAVYANLIPAGKSEILEVFSPQKGIYYPIDSDMNVRNEKGGIVSRKFVEFDPDVRTWYINTLRRGVTRYASANKWAQAMPYIVVFIAVILSGVMWLVATHNLEVISISLETASRNFENIANKMVDVASQVAQTAGSASGGSGAVPPY